MTPALALSRLRASLITLVSIKYIRTVFVLYALEVRVFPHVRHGGNRGVNKKGAGKNGRKPRRLLSLPTTAPTTTDPRFKSPILPFLPAYCEIRVYPKLPASPLSYANCCALLWALSCSLTDLLPPHPQHPAPAQARGAPGFPHDSPRPRLRAACSLRTKFFGKLMPPVPR